MKRRYFLQSFLLAPIALFLVAEKTEEINDSKTLALAIKRIPVITQDDVVRFKWNDYDGNFTTINGADPAHASFSLENLLAQIKEIETYYG